MYFQYKDTSTLKINDWKMLTQIKRKISEQRILLVKKLLHNKKRGQFTSCINF